MLYFLFGILSGIILSFAPFFLPESSIEIYPEWYAGIELSGSGELSNSIGRIQSSHNQSISGIVLKPIINNSNIYILKGNGKLLKKIRINDNLVSVSEDGKYYIKYAKVGTHIELLNTDGDRFWRMESKEYPYISSNAEIILLMNGDHSRIRISDINGNLTGAKEIHGRLCTGISFSESGYSAIGFLDGNYYLLNKKGEIIGRGLHKNIIKEIAISANGKYYAVHYGNEKTDFVKLIDIHHNEKIFELHLEYAHPAKTALHVTDSGILTVMDYDRIIISQNSETKRIIIPPKSPGLSSIDFFNDIYFAGYTGIDGRVHFFMFRENTVLFHKIMTEENFIDVSVQKNSILLTGSHNLYCYSVQIPGIQ